MNSAAPTNQTEIESCLLNNAADRGFVAGAKVYWFDRSYVIVSIAVSFILGPQPQVVLDLWHDSSNGTGYGASCVLDDAVKLVLPPKNTLGVITVVNKYWHKSTPNDIYCGRGSPLGNPYSHMEGTKALYKVATRDEAIKKYKPWFEHARLNDPVAATMLGKMRCVVASGRDINLACYCAPQPCHCDVIKEYLEWSLKL